MEDIYCSDAKSEFKQFWLGEVLLKPTEIFPNRAKVL